MIDGFKDLANKIDRYLTNDMKEDVFLEYLSTYAHMHMRLMRDEDILKAVKTDIAHIATPIDVRPAINTIGHAIFMIVRDMTIHTCTRLFPADKKERHYVEYNNLVTSLIALLPEDIVVHIKNAIMVDNEIDNLELEFCQSKINNIKLLSTEIYHATSITTMLHNAQDEEKSLTVSRDYSQQLADHVNKVTSPEFKIEVQEEKVIKLHRKLYALERGLRAVWISPVKQLVNTSGEELAATIDNHKKLKKTYKKLTKSLEEYMELKYPKDAKEYNGYIPYIIELLSDRSLENSIFQAIYNNR